MGLKNTTVETIMRCVLAIAGVIVMLILLLPIVTAIL